MSNQSTMLSVSTLPTPFIALHRSRGPDSSRSSLNSSSPPPSSLSPLQGSFRASSQATLDGSEPSPSSLGTSGSRPEPEIELSRSGTWRAES